MPTIRLQSLKGEPREGFIPLGIHGPGLLKWAIASYSGKAGDSLVRIIAESFSLKREVALAILTGEVDICEEGADVVFRWPTDDPFVKKAGDEADADSDDHCGGADAANE